MPPPNHFNTLIQGAVRADWEVFGLFKARPVALMDDPGLQTQLHREVFDGVFTTVEILEVRKSAGTATNPCHFGPNIMVGRVQNRQPFHNLRLKES